MVKDMSKGKHRFELDFSTEALARSILENVRVFRVLAFIGFRKIAAVQEISRKLGVSEASVRRYVKALANAGLVCFSRGLSRRKIYVEITEYGMEVAKLVVEKAASRAKEESCLKEYPVEVRRFFETRKPHRWATLKAVYDYEKLSNILKHYGIPLSKIISEERCMKVNYMGKTYLIEHTF